MQKCEDPAQAKDPEKTATMEKKELTGYSHNFVNNIIIYNKL